MKIDRKTVDMLAALTDENLARLCRLYASRFGLRPQGTPGPEAIRRIRTALAMLTDEDIARMANLAEASKHKGGT